MINRQTSLSKNIVQFCRFLRLKGFTVGMEEETLTLQALQLIDYGSNQVFLLALKAILCRSEAQLNEFNTLFEEYWKELKRQLMRKKIKNPNKDEYHLNRHLLLNH